MVLAVAAVDAQSLLFWGDLGRVAMRDAAGGEGARRWWSGRRADGATGRTRWDRQETNRRRKVCRRARGIDAGYVGEM